MVGKGSVHALKFAAVLLDVIVIGVYRGALDIARGLEHEGNLHYVFVPASRVIVFAASGVHVRDSARERVHATRRPFSGFRKKEVRT